jgi:uncharacterized protein YbaR (Trm112 family)
MLCPDCLQHLIWDKTRQLLVCENCWSEFEVKKISKGDVK